MTLPEPIQPPPDATVEFEKTPGGTVVRAVRGRHDTGRVFGETEQAALARALLFTSYDSTRMAEQLVDEIMLLRGLVVALAERCGIDVGNAPQPEVAYGDQIDALAITQAQRREQAYAQRAGVLADLDRCHHGRHEGDDCYGCHGPSTGNPFMQDNLERAGFGLVEDPDGAPYPPRTIGLTLSGKPIEVPRRGEEWKRR